MIGSDTFKVLNSSLAHSAGELYPLLRLTMCTFCGILLKKQKYFLRHNFGSRNAKKPIKSSKDWDDSLFSKKILSQKLLAGLGSGEDDLGQKRVTLSQLWRHPQKNKIPNLKLCFFNLN